ncbi:hypothetical protein B0H12DRAFT_148596 [Mycena haematopus]|nr:hypothetical protein B0H12DRAFT_148596 [Mycena haematopus]
MPNVSWATGSVLSRRFARLPYISLFPSPLPARSLFFPTLANPPLQGLPNPRHVDDPHRRQLHDLRSRTRLELSFLYVFCPCFPAVSSMPPGLSLPALRPTTRSQTDLTFFASQIHPLHLIPPPVRLYRLHPKRSLIVRTRCLAIPGPPP